MSDEAVRILVILTAVISMGALGTNWIARRRHITRRSRRVLGWLYGMMGILAYSSGEGLARGLPLNHGSYALLFCFAGLIGSLLWHPKGDNDFPPGDNSWGQRLINLLHHEKERKKNLNKWRNNQ